MIPELRTEPEQMKPIIERACKVVANTTPWRDPVSDKLTLPEVERLLASYEYEEATGRESQEEHAHLRTLRALREALVELDALGPVEWECSGDGSEWSYCATRRDHGVPCDAQHTRAIRVVKGGA